MRKILASMCKIAFSVFLRAEAEYLRNEADIQYAQRDDIAWPRFAY